MANLPVSTTSKFSPGPSTPSTFQVKNIDDKGRIIHVGYLDINPSELVFRYEHHPEHEARWPLSCVRKYGISLEGDVFAFEVGRRAPDGEGTFAFRTEGVKACEIRQRVDYFTQSGWS